jgi:tetratricopeptide (TPR) repeat protein
MATDGPLGEPLAALSLCQQAENLIEVGRCRDALPLVARALSLEPELLQAHALQSLALWKLGEFREALRAANAAVRLAPDDDLGHRLRCQALWRLGDARECLAAAERGVQLAPDVPDTIRLLAHALLLNGRRRDAQVAADRLIQVDPEHAASHEMAGLVAVAERRWADAERSFLRQLALAPESPEALNNLAVVIERQGRVDEAIRRLQEAARLQPQQGHVQWNLRRLATTWVLRRSRLARVASVAMLLVLALQFFGPAGPEWFQWLEIGLLAACLAGMLRALYAAQRSLGRVYPPLAEMRRSDERRERPELFEIGALSFLIAAPVALVDELVAPLGMRWMTVLFGVATIAALFGVLVWRVRTSSRRGDPPENLGWFPIAVVGPGVLAVSVMGRPYRPPAHPDLHPWLLFLGFAALAFTIGRLLRRRRRS